MNCSLETLERRLIKRSVNSKRKDDNIETIRKRFTEFHAETDPFIKEYQEHLGPIEEVNCELEK